jgi:hypothetical protein
VDIFRFLEKIDFGHDKVVMDSKQVLGIDAFGYTPVGGTERECDSSEQSLGPAGRTNDGTALLSRQEASSKTRLEEHSLEENAGEPSRRKSPALEARYRILYSEVRWEKLLVK